MKGESIMIFEIEKNITKIVDNEPTEISVTSVYRAELENGIFELYETIEDTEFKIISQPFNFTETGQRIEWNNIEEGIQWFKQTNGYSEE
jgi:hypothetical protein